jgi:hypothetical protein
MTTFKPELCRNGSRLLEVYYQNAASNIQVINAERALDVISQFANERQSNNEEM